MSRRFHGRSTTAALALLLVAGCSSSPGGSTTTGGSMPAPPPAAQRSLGKPHIMHTHFPDRTKATKQALPQATGAQLVYYGGPVLGKVKVFTVFWSSQVQFQSQLNAFYTAITNSAYFDWLSEYNTPSTTIGRGSFIGSLVDPAPPASTSLTNADIQNELSKLIDAKQIPAPDANTLYMVHFPPGVSIDLDGSGSCQVFCAYHNTYTHNGVNVYYGVMPDQGGACAGGCGSDPSLFNNLTSVSSHELIESVTDAAVGLATTIGPPLAWYDQTNGEIGDICNAEQGTVGSYVVQKEWSNKNNACITTAGTCTPVCTGKQCGDDGCGGSCGTCPSGQTCDANGQCQTGCVPQCTDKQCGDDGCGGSCGTCPTGQTCDANGQCQTGCVPQCSGKQCGDDGCGGSCGTCPSGQTCDANGQCQGSTGACDHGLCDTGTQLQSGCDPCVTQICASDSYCCTTAWDSICVGEVGSICGETCNTPPPACAHDLCTAGGALQNGCDQCVTDICAQDPYCCSTAWDRICVGEVGSICGESCTKQCAHDECTTGGALQSGCDSCVTTVCSFDAYCCSTAWDSICVSEAGGFCGKTCN